MPPATPADATDTQDFGFTFANTARYLTGVAYRDLNNNGRYDQREGLAGVTITVEGNATYTITSASGGYALPLSGRGTLVARAAGGPLGTDAATRGFATAGESVKWDLVLDGSGNLLGDQLSGTSVSVTSDYARRGFVITRTGDVSAALEVLYRVGGAAVGGLDYDSLPGVVTFVAGAAEAFVPVVAHTRQAKVKVFLEAGAGYGVGKGQGKLVLANL